MLAKSVIVKLLQTTKKDELEPTIFIHIKLKKKRSKINTSTSADLTC